MLQIKLIQFQKICNETHTITSLWCDETQWWFRTCTTGKIWQPGKSNGGKKIQTITKPTHLWQPGQTMARWSQLEIRDVVKIPKTLTRTKNKMQQKTKPTHWNSINYQKLLTNFWKVITIWAVILLENYCLYLKKAIDQFDLCDYCKIFAVMFRKPQTTFISKIRCLRASQAKNWLEYFVGLGLGINKI